MPWTISSALMASFENSRCSPERAGESSAASCADSVPSAPSKSTPIAALFCAPDRTREYSRLFPFGTTCEPLTESRGAELLTWFLGGFPVRTCPSQTRKARGLTGNGQGCGLKCGELLAKYDRDSSSWRTPQISLIRGVSESLATLPRWGTTVNGVLWALTTPERLTGATGGGALLPTPMASLAAHGGPNQRDRSGRAGLQMAAMKWSTPTVNDAKNNGTQSQMRRNTLALNCAVKMLPTPLANSGTGASQSPNKQGGMNLQTIIGGGQLNPRWVEWLMGWPIGWASLERLETDRFRQWLNSFGKS